MKHLILLLSLLLNLSCVHENTSSETNPEENKSKPVVHEAIVNRDPSYLTIQRNHPQAVKIMQEACKGNYEIISDMDKSATKNQMEIGLTKSLGDGKEAKTNPYIKYKCISK